MRTKAWAKREREAAHLGRPPSEPLVEPSGGAGPPLPLPSAADEEEAGGGAVGAGAPTCSHTRIHEEPRRSFTPFVPAIHPGCAWGNTSLFSLCSSDLAAGGVAACAAGHALLQVVQRGVLDRQREEVHQALGLRGGRRQQRERTASAESA